MSKPKYVKLTNERTCRIVAGLTKDPEHIGKCPIIMTGEKYKSINPYIDWKKSQQNTVESFMKDMFGDFFK